MSKKVIALRSVDTLKRIYDALKTNHNGFPILNLNGQVIGLIPRNFLIVILSKRQFYSDPGQKYFVIDG